MINLSDMVPIEPYIKMAKSVEEACEENNKQQVGSILIAPDPSTLSQHRNKSSYSLTCAIVKESVWGPYWEEVRKEEQRRKDLSLERTHYMVE